MSIAIVGAGIMGADIAQAVALGGYPVILIDTDERILRLALARISRGIEKGVRLDKVDARRARQARHAFTISTDLEKCAPAEIVIEAVYEDPETKRTLFDELAALVPAQTIFATSTNTLSVTALAQGISHPERVIGLHFFNPAHIMKLVEVVRGERTGQETVNRALEFVRKIGKTPLVVPDTPGWVVNRIAQAYFGEALALLDDHSGLDVPTIDRLMEAAGFPMGPFRLMDFLGVDTAFEVALTIYNETFYASSYRPHPRLKRMMEAGRTGRQGRGFYEETS